jgi:hypothetical protein
MKKNTNIPAFVFLVLMSLAGCDNVTLSKPDIQTDPGHGMVLISLAGANVLPSPDARTMLPQNPEFTRYELEFFDADTGNNILREPYSFTNSTIQLQLPADTDYYIAANGYDGEVLAAKSIRIHVNISEGDFD